LDIKRSISAEVKLLCNGSISSAVKSLLQNTSVFIISQTLSGITVVINKECSLFHKKSETTIKTKPSDLHNFKFKNLPQEFERETPVTWCLLKSVARNRKGECNEVKVATASTLLFHSRSATLNALQHIVSICLYNNQLQKEGFLILSKLGVTTTHATLNNTLNRVKNHVTQSMLELKCSLEENANKTTSNNQSKNDHEYARNYFHEQNVVGMDHDYIHIDRNRNGNFNSGYRFNIDNLEFLLQVRNMTQDHQNQSKHYVQLMAIKDRVNCEDLIDDRPIGNLLQVPNQDFLPNGEDIDSLRKDVIHVVANVLVKNLASFHIFHDVISQGFEHEVSE